MAIPSFPSFSKPTTRTQFNAVLVKLTRNFQDQGISLNDSKRLASQIVTFKNQGLTDSQISKNLQQDRLFQEEKSAERLQEIQDARDSQKDLLEKLAREKAERVKLQAERKARKIALAKERREKRQIILVANPNNPRGALIPKSVADEILRKRREQGKTTKVSSIQQKNNPSIIDRIRESLRFKNDDSNASVVAVNRTLVLLSNGTTVPRSSFKGVIPEKFLTGATKQRTPENNASLEDIERNKAIITNPLSNVRTKKEVSTSLDPSKTISTAKRSTSVFKPTEAPETTLGTLIEDAQEFFTETFNLDSTTEPKKESEPIDIFKGITDFLESFSTPTIIPSANAEPEPTVQPKPTPEPTVQPTPEPEPETSFDIVKLVKENGVKIGASILGITVLGFVVLASVGTSQLGITDAQS